MTSTLSSQTIEQLVAKAMPSANAQELAQASQLLTMALAADPESPEAQIAWLQLELVVGSDVRTIVQAAERAAAQPEVDLVAQAQPAATSKTYLEEDPPSAGKQDAAVESPVKGEANGSFGEAIVRALAEGMVPSVSAPSEVLSGLGNSSPTTGFTPAGNDSGVDLSGLSADMANFAAAARQLQAAAGSLFVSTGTYASGTQASGVQVSQAAGMASLGVPSDLVNDALVTPFVLQQVSPSGALGQQLDTAGHTSRMGDPITASALTVGSGVIGTTDFAPTVNRLTIPLPMTTGPAALLAMDPIHVNEGSPYAVFTVEGTPGQLVRLELGSTISTDDRDAKLGVETANAGQNVPLQIYNGSQWVDYVPGSLVGIPTSGTHLLVRTRIVQDDLPQGAKTFTLRATNTDNMSVTAVATISDDGTGDLYPDAPAGVDGLPVVDVTSPRDDDRPLLSMSTPANVAEGGFAVATLKLDRPLDRIATIELSLTHGTTEPGDVSEFAVFTDPNDPVGSALLVRDGRFTLPAGVVTVYVRAGVPTDNVFEGREAFSITAGFVDTDLRFQDPTGTNTAVREGALVSGSVGVSDEGTGLLVGPGGLPVNLPAVDERPVMTVTGVPDASEGSPVVFTVSLSKPSEQPVEIEFDLADVTTEPGDLVPGMVIFTNPADPAGSMLTVTNGRVVLPPGVVTVYARVSTGVDGVYEGSESFTLTTSFVSPELRYQDPTGTSTALRPGAVATGTSTVTDDSAGTVTGPGGLPLVAVQPPADERPTLALTGQSNVAEGSVAAFVVTLSKPSEHPTELELTVTGIDTERGDYGSLVAYTDPADPVGSALPIINGRVVVPAGITTIYTHVPTTTDGVYEGPERLSLTVGFVSTDLTSQDPTGARPGVRPGSVVTAVSTVTDDGSGQVHGPGGLPLVGTPAVDERPLLTMTGQPDVSEGGHATFTLTLSKPSEQPTQVELMLTPTDTEPGDVGSFVVFTDPLDPVGSALVVTNGRFTLPPGVTTVYTQVATSIDGVYEGPEDFSVTARLVSTDLRYQDPTGSNLTERPGSVATAVSTVTDDGTGTVYGPGGLPVIGGPTPADERPTLSVAGKPDVSEGSPAVFTLTLSKPSEHAVEVALSVSDVTTEPGDVGLMVVFTDPANPSGSQLVVTNGRFMLPPGVTTFYTAVSTTADGVFEGGEDFRLTASLVQTDLANVDATGTVQSPRPGSTATAVSTVIDDSTGTVYGPGGLPVVDNPSTVGVDESAGTDDRPRIAVSSPRINEGASHAVFAVSLNHLSDQHLTFTPTLATTGTGIGHAVLGTDVGDSTTLEYSVDGGQTWSSATSGVTIPAGLASVLVRTPVMNEVTPLYEGPETFELVTGPVTVGTTGVPAFMHNPQGAVGTGTIADDGTGAIETGTPLDDDRPTMTVLGNTVLEDGGWSVFTVELDRVSGLDVQFTPRLRGSTATVGDDTGPSSTIEYYDTATSTWMSAASGVTIAAGQTTVTLRAPVVDDLLDEEDEAIELVTGAVDGVTNGTDAGAAGVSLIVDNDPSFAFDSQAVTVVEGDMMNFVVRRVSGSGVPVTLDWSILVASSDSSALPVLRTGTVTFAANQDQATISLQSVDEQRITDDQRLYVSLATSDGDIHITQGTVTGIVKNNDAQIGIGSITASGPDANGLFTYQVTVERTGALGFDHSVRWSVAGVGENPARAGDFRLPQDVIVEFPANTTPGATSDTQTFTFQAAAGLVIDGQRTFEVTLQEDPSTSAMVELGRSAARGVITPHGAAVTIETVTTNLIEGSAVNDSYTHTFRVNLSQAQSSDVVVRWDVASFGSGTAVDANAADFGGAFPGGTVTILAGQTSALIQFAPSPDSDLEPGERFLVDFSVQSGPANKVGPAAIGRIANDEAVVEFASATFSGNEGDNGTGGTLTATVAREEFLRSAATVSWHVEAINGATDADVRAYFASGQNAGNQASGLPSGTVTLQPGQVQSEIILQLVGNSLIEASRNFRIVLDNPEAGTTLGAQTTATATILDDDARFEMSAPTVVHEEGNAGASFIEVVVNRIGDARLPAAVTWTALGSGADPTSSTDLQQNNSAGTLLFAAGETSAVIRIAVRPDDIVEANEQLTVRLTGTGTAHHTLGSALTTVVTLNNDDSTVSFDATPSNITQVVNEDGAGPAFSGAGFTFVVTRAGDTRSAVDVPWSIPLTGNLTASDFVATSGMAHFAAGSSTATITVVAVNDTLVEADETFDVVLAPVAGSGVSLGANAVANGTLANDDVRIEATLVGAPTEGDGGATSTYTFTLTRVGDTTRQASDVNWSVGGYAVTINGVSLAGALSNAEFSGATSGNVSWAAGDTSTRTVTVTVQNDSAIEGDEAFQLNLSHNGSDRSDLAANGTIAVVHDDDAQVSITRLAQATVVEGADGSSQSVAFRVQRSGDLSSTLTVDLVASGVAGATGPTSVTFNPQTSSVVVTLANGQTQTLALEGGQQFVDVSFTLPGDDVVQGNRSFNVSLANPQAQRSTGQPDQTTIDSSAASAAVTVTDDDDRIVATAATSTVVEGDSGNTTITYTLTRTGDTSKATVVNWRIQPGTGVAANADDFTAGQEDITVPNGGMPSGRVSFAPGQTSASITVNVSSDTTVEGDENLLLNLDVVAGNSELVNTQVTILTDDAGYNVLARETSIVEGNDPSTPRYIDFDVVRSGHSSSSTVDWAITGINLADIESVEVDGVNVGAALSGSIAFSGAQTGALVRVRIAQDQIAELTETATLTVTDPANSNATVGTASSQLVNDDSALSISANLASISEGSDTDLTRIADGTPSTATLTYTVTRTGNLNQVTNVNWSVLAQGGVAAADFVDGILPTGALTFAAGESSKTITVQVRQDWEGEADEAITVQLSNPSTGTQLLAGSASTTVFNDDATISFAGNTTVGTAQSRTEGDSGFVTYTFTVNRSGDTSREQQVAWQVSSDDTQLTINDFYDTYLSGTTPTLPFGTVTFAANDSQTSKTITIKVKSDSFTPTVPAFPGTASQLEANEPFKIELSNPQTSVKHIGYSVPSATSTAYGEIVNDDVRIAVTNVTTNRPEGRDPSLNGGDADPQQVGVQRWITHSITIKRMGDPSQAVSFEWFIDQPGFADRFVIADSNGNLPNGTWGVANGTSAAGIASGTYQAGTAVNGVSRGELSGLLSWAAGDTSDRVLYFTPNPNDTPEGDFSVVVKARENSNAPAESAIIDEFGPGVTDAVNTTLANGSISLATLTVRRDEAQLWISNSVIRTYNSETSSWELGSSDQVFEANPRGTLGPASSTGMTETNAEGTVITANAGSDYTATTSTLTFDNTHRTRTIDVALNRDAAAEERETFSVRLDGAVNGTVASDQANITVMNGDGTSRDYKVAVNGSTAIEGVDEYVQFRVDFGKPLSQANTFKLDMSGTALQDDLNTGDYFKYVEVSSDGGQTWQSTAPKFGFDATLSRPATQAGTIHTRYEFDNEDAAEGRFDSWLDFSDLQAGAGYKVGGSLGALTFGAATPPPLDTSGRLYVVVEADGAYVDVNNDGIRNAGENTLAFDPAQQVGTDGGTGGMAWKDLIGLGTNAVTIKFNALPSVAGTTNQLALNAMGNDDFIEIDLRALSANGAAVGTDNLQAATSTYVGAPGHPAFIVRENDIVVNATKDGIQYTTTLEGYRNAYGDGPPVEHHISLQFGNGPKIQLGQLGLGYGWSWPVSQVLAGHNFMPNTSNGLLDQMSFVNPISTPMCEIWVPVRADAQFDLQALGLEFSGVPAGGTARGSFKGLADLSASSTINDEALDYFRTLVSNPNATLEDIQSYFKGFDSHQVINDDVVFLKFAVEWDGLGSPTWAVTGLDASAVVAPQNGDWQDLNVIQTVPVSSGQTTVHADVQLGTHAAFTSPEPAEYDADGILVTPAHAVVELVAAGATGGSLAATDAQLGWDGTFTAAAGADSVLIRTPIVNDSIDEIVERIDMGVTHVSGDNFIGATGTGTVELVDDDSPQITVGTAVIRDEGRTIDYVTKIVDINNRAGDTPDLTTDNGVYMSESQLNNMAAGQSFTVQVRYQGTWEVAAISEIMASSTDAYQQQIGAEHNHGSAPGFAELQGTAEVINGQPTGFYTALVEVKAGTYQLLLRSAVGTIATAPAAGNVFELTDLTSAEQLRANSISVAVGHVDPVFVARDVSASEADGRAQVEVVAVGGDFNNGAATVAAQTVDGAWKERTFVISRELTSKGELTVTWELEAPNNLPAGVGQDEYVLGYYESASVTPSTSADFIALGGQTTTATGIRGRAVFAEGQKEAIVTIRVRSDDDVETIKDFGVRITGEVINGVEVPLVGNNSQSFDVVGNPQLPGLYESSYGSAGFGRIDNDDRAFSVTGHVFNESVNTNSGVAASGLANPGVTLTPPPGYTLHQFVIKLEGTGPGAASVQWQLKAAGVDGDAGFNVGSQTMVNGRPTQAADAHRAEAEDFLVYDANQGDYSSSYGFQWVAATSGTGMVSVPKTVHFADGVAERVITIAVKDDLHIEDAEQFSIELLNPQALQGSTGAVDLNPLKKETSFLIGDNDGATVKLEFGWTTAQDATLQSLQLLNNGDAINEGSGQFFGTGAPGNSGWQLRTPSEWQASGQPYMGTDTNAVDDRRIVLKFTRENADLTTASQSFFELESAGNGSLNFTVEQGNVFKVPNDQVWRGIVDFLPGKSEAYVVLRLPDDLTVEAAEMRLKATLYDAETFPQSAYTNQYAAAPTPGWDAGIGASGALADWNVSRRDPLHYQAEIKIADDDVRLWFGSMTENGGYEFNHDLDPNTAPLTLGTYDVRAAAFEGSPAWNGASDQAHVDGDGNFSFTVSRQGAAAGTISLRWEVVLSGNANASDFNSALFDAGATYVNADGHTVLVALAPVSLNAGAAATTVVRQTVLIDGLFSTDRAVEANKTFDFVMKTPTSSLGNTVLYGANPTGEQGPLPAVAQLKVGVTVVNDDVEYSVAWNASNPSVNGAPATVLEADSGAAVPNVLHFDVSRVLGGYQGGSTVAWRVVPVNGYDISAADFFDTYSLNGAASLPYGTVTFTGRTTDANGNTLTPAQLVRSVELRIKGDNAVEVGEHFRIELYDPSIGYVNQSTGAVEGVIVNDDTGLRVETTNVSEGDSGDTTVTVTVTRYGDLVRTNKTTQTTEFDWDVVDLDTNSADRGTGSFSGTGVQLPANSNAVHVDGYAEETTTFTYKVAGDATVESDEQMAVLLSGVTGVDEVHNAGRGTVNVLNDDTVFSVIATPGSEVANQTVVENAGGTYSFRITRDVSVPQSQTVTWSVVGAGGRNVVNAADFGGTLPSGTVTFAPGELYKDITFSAVSADNTVETDEVFTVKVTGFGTGAENDTFVTTGAGAMGKIVSDEQAVFIGDSLPITQAEGTGSDVRTYRFEIVRAGSTGPVTSTVDWALDFTNTGADASDFVGPTSGTVTFIQDGSQIVEVTIAADAVREASLQDFNIVLSNGTGGAQILTSSVQGIIGDDDYSLSVAAASTAEGDGNNQVAFTVTRTGSTALAATVQWQLDFASRTASATDFRDVSDANAADGVISGTFTVPAGATTYTFYVPVQGDTQWEGDETFNLTLDYGVGTTSAIGTLTNDDEGFSVGAITPVSESAGTVTFRVLRDGNLSGTSSVDWSLTGSGLQAATTTGAGNDFSGALSGTVTFADNEAYKDVTVTIVDDSVQEVDETFTVTLVNPGPGSSIKSVADGSATGTVLNDDQGYSVSASAVAITENAGAGASVTFTITRAITTGASSITWALSNPSGDASAVALADLLVNGVAASNTALSGTTVNFATGEATKTVTVALASDAVLENQALLRMTLARAGADTTSTLLVPSADVQVIDDDEKLSLVPLSLSSVAEGSSGTTPIQFKVTREGSSIGDATATWTLEGAGANAITASDIDRIEIDGVVQQAGALTGTLTFVNGSMADKLVTVYLRGDTQGEFDEAFSLKLSSPSTGASLGTSSATQQVLNDDPAMQLVMSTTQFNEGNEGADRAISFQVVRTGDISQAATVNWSVLSAASGNSVNAADFGGYMPMGQVVFRAGEASKTVTFMTAGDDLWENNEGFRVELSGASAGTTIIGPSQVAGTLVNDDAQVSIAAVGNGTVLERHAGQTSTAQFALSVQGLPTASHVLVSWHAEGVGLNPANGADFVGGVLPSGQTNIGISAGAGTANINLNIAGDNIFGPSEQFKVVIDSITAYNGSTVVGGGTATVGSATMTVLDDDIMIGLSQSETHRVIEGDSTTTMMRFYVDELARSTNAATMADVRVDYHVSGDVDSADLSGATATNAALTQDTATGRYYFEVGVTGDTAVEGTERFTVHLDGARTVSGGGVEVAQSGSTVAGQVLDDDFGIRIVSSNLSQAEDSARFVFDVLRTGPTDEAMTVEWKLGNPTLNTGEWGVSANDFLDPVTQQPYTTTNGSITGTLTFAAGESTARFTLEASHDTVAETDERFAVQVAVTEVAGVTLTPQPHQIDTVVGVIAHDEVLPVGFDPSIDQQVHQPLHPV